MSTILSINSIEQVYIIALSPDGNNSQIENFRPTFMIGCYKRKGQWKSLSLFNIYHW